MFRDSDGMGASGRVVRVLACGAVLASLGGGILAAERAERSWTWTFDPESAAIRKVVVDNVFGEIEVRGGDGESVRVEVRERVVGDTAADVELARREVELLRSQDDGEHGETVELVVDGPFRRRDDRERWIDHGERDYTVTYDLELVVPRSVDVDLRTVNDGDIRVDGVEGEFRLRNVNGEVELVGTRRHGRASTVNGEIRVVFAEQPDAPCRFETVNGDVRLEFAQPLDAQAHMRTMNGELLSEFPGTLLPPKTETDRSRGMTRVRHTWSSVRFGRGGPDLYVETLNGDVLVRRASRGGS